MHINKILLPVDFSGRSEHAARYAIPLAEHFEAEVTLLHVLPPYHDIGMLEAGAAMADWIEQRQAQARHDLDNFLCAEMAGIRTRRVLLHGDPASEIVDFAHTDRSHWIVMPTHGYGPFRRLLLGSVTAKVLHDADCAVWTGVHIEEAPPGEPARPKHILCAVNLSASSPRVLAWASRLAEEFQSCLTVLHVVEALLPGTEGYVLSPEWRREVTEHATADLASLQRSVGPRAAVSLRAGDTAFEIAAEVERLHADLLVIGRSSEKGILGRLTERAYAIIRQSPCPVASV